MHSASVYTDTIVVVVVVANFIPFIFVIFLILCLDSIDIIMLFVFFYFRPFFFVLPRFSCYMYLLSHSLQLGNCEHLLTAYYCNSKWNATRTHHHCKSTKSKIWNFLFSQLFCLFSHGHFPVLVIRFVLKSEWIRSRLCSTNNYNESIYFSTITYEFSGWSDFFSCCCFLLALLLFLLICFVQKYFNLFCFESGKIVANCVGDVRFAPFTNAINKKSHCTDVHRVWFRVLHRVARKIKAFKSDKNLPSLIGCEKWLYVIFRLEIDWHSHAQIANGLLFLKKNQP